MDQFVYQLYETACDGLRQLQKKQIELLEESLSGEHVDVFIMFRTDLNSHFDDLEEALEQITLVNLATRFKQKLLDLARSYEKQRTRAPVGNTNKSESTRDNSEVRFLIRRYSKQFNIDLTSGPGGLAYFHELIVARNEVIHSNGEITHRYLSQFPQPAFGDAIMKRVAFPSDQILKATAHVKTYIAWLSSELDSWAARQAS